MTLNGEIEIISAFSRDLTRELTIHQVSKEIKKSYAFTNKEARNMIDKGMLNRKIVGHSILCSLNFSNELTRMALCINSIGQKNGFFAENLDLSKKASEFFSEVNKDAVYCILFDGKRIAVVCRDSSAVNVRTDFDLAFVDIDEVRGFVKSIDLKSTIIIYGYEKFWEFVGDALE